MQAMNIAVYSSLDLLLVQIKSSSCYTSDIYMGIYIYGTLENKLWDKKQTSET